MNDLINPRTEFLQAVHNHLQSRDFERTDDVWELSMLARASTGVVVINGRQHEQITEFNIRMVCEALGAGEVISDDGRIEPFELFKFELYQDDVRRWVLNRNVYYSEFHVFQELIAKLFNL